MAGPCVLIGAGSGSRPRIARSAGDEEPATPAASGRGAPSSTGSATDTDTDASVGSSSSRAPAAAIHAASSGSLIDPGTPAYWETPSSRRPGPAYADADSADNATRQAASERASGHVDAVPGAVPLRNLSLIHISEPTRRT